MCVHFIWDLQLLKHDIHLFCWFQFTLTNIKVSFNFLTSLLFIMKLWNNIITCISNEVKQHILFYNMESIWIKSYGTQMSKDQGPQISFRSLLICAKSNFHKYFTNFYYTSQDFCTSSFKLVKVFQDTWAQYTSHNCVTVHMLIRSLIISIVFLLPPNQPVYKILYP